MIDAKHHELSVAVSGQPLWVGGDLIRLAQVISNLLTNAAKYTDNGGQISVGAAREGEEIVVRIRDTGVGISPELQSRIFELFVQGDRSLDRSQGGLGIGLTLVKRLVEMHGGSVAVASQGAGQGSEFSIRLPANEDSMKRPHPALRFTQLFRMSLRVDEFTPTATYPLSVIQLL